MRPKIRVCASIMVLRKSGMRQTSHKSLSRAGARAIAAISGAAASVRRLRSSSASGERTSPAHGAGAARLPRSAGSEEKSSRELR